MQNLSGIDVGRYHIIEPLGEGGMAVVYKAFDTRLEREVAMKFIRVERIPPVFLSDMLKRFEREAKVLAKFMHPNIVPILDYGEHDSYPFLVMAYVPGGDLNRFAGKTLAYSEAARLLLPIAQALDYAHRRGVVHRDLKPANILIMGEGQPVVSDFGIAKILSNETGTTLTQAGMSMGTPGYMAPEQIEGRPDLDGRVDIYALGMILYELITGRRPFLADTPEAVMLKQIHDPMPRPLQFTPGLPAAVEFAIFKATARHPADRYQTMAEFATGLEDLLNRALAPQAGALPTAEHSAVSATGTSPVVTPAAPAPMPTPTAEKTSTPAEPLSPSPGIATVHDDAPWKTPQPRQSLQTEATPVPGSTSGYTPPIQAEAQPGAGVPRWAGGLVGVTGLILLAVLVIAVANGRIPLLPRPAVPVDTAVPATPGLGSMRVSGQDGMVQVYVPAGGFQRGWDVKQEGQPAADTPPSLWTIDINAFWIDRTEVTNAMYAKCVAAGGCSAPAQLSSLTRAAYYGDAVYADYPVIWVDWNQARTYCQWAGRRLPTEAEWEKAARGSDGRLFPWGTQAADCSLANYACAEGNVGDTNKVGSYPYGASPYEALDMAGNVWEWVADWYSAEYYVTAMGQNPQGPAAGIQRVLRGGSYYIDAVSARISFRTAWTPDSKDVDVGFRCAN